MLVKTDRDDKLVAEALQDFLADLHMVYSHLHNFHWNVEGAHFFEYHEHLQDAYENVAERIDDTAERLLQIGYRPLTNLVEYASRSELDALPSEAIGVPQVIDSVITDTEKLIGDCFKIITNAQQCGDEGTADYAIEVLREQEKALWFWKASRG